MRLAPRRHWITLIPLPAKTLSLKLEPGRQPLCRPTAARTILAPRGRNPDPSRHKPGPSRSTFAISQLWRAARTTVEFALLPARMTLAAAAEPCKTTLGDDCHSRAGRDPLEKKGSSAVQE
jgi:hypothetical protein